MEKKKEVQESKTKKRKKNKGEMIEKLAYQTKGGDVGMRRQGEVTHLLGRTEERERKKVRQKENKK